MQLHEKSLELLTLYELVNSTRAQNVLLPKLTVDHFHTTAVKNTYKRAMLLLQKRSKIPVWEAMLADPAIAEADRALLKRYKPPKADRIRNTARALEVVDILGKFATLRKLAKMGDYLNEQLRSSEIDVDAVMDETTNLLTQARTGITSENTVFHTGVGTNTTQLLKRVLNRKESPLYPTGFTSFDSVNGGLPKTGLFVLAAYTSSGKSAMANQLLINMYEINQINTVKLSLEMGDEQEHSRMWSNISGVPLSKFSQAKLSNEDKKTIVTAYTKFVKHGKTNECRMSILSPKTDMTLTQALTELRPYGYKVIFVDYITLLAGSGGDQQWMELSNIAREAKIFGEANNCLVVMLAQLDEDNKIRYARAIREHADGVWQWAVSDDDREAGKFTVKQVKGRDQTIMSWDVNVDWTTLKITDEGNGNTLDDDDDDVKEYSSKNGFKGGSVGAGDDDDLRDHSLD